ncbi:addiction module protein [Nocardioides sp. GXZ039]|uniref:addiction module protein n=1 Tax=Nocardioides sp. GXZ039 TaxID=3136018 RepID=UPI0030F3F0CC
MVSTELLAAVDALSDDERIELVAHIEETLDADLRLTPEQLATIERRHAELVADLDRGLSLDEAIAAVRALTA